LDDGRFDAIEQIRNDIRSRLSPAITDAQRQSFSAASHQTTPLQIAANEARLRMRINNTIGDGGSNPPQGTGYLFIGHGIAPTVEVFDQVLRPGESILVDAPTLQIFILTRSLSPMTGTFNVVEYY
jgi:hypothetical protein